MNLWKNTACQGRHFIMIKTQWFGNLSDAAQLPCLAKCQMHNVHSHPQLCEHVSKVNLHYLHYQAQLLKRKKKNQLYKSTKKTQGAETIAIFCYFFKLTYKYQKKGSYKTNVTLFVCISVYKGSCGR